MTEAAYNRVAISGVFHIVRYTISLRYLCP